MTKKYKTIYLISAIVSWLLCYGTAALLIGCSIAKKEPSQEGIQLSQYIGPALYSMGISIIIMAVMSIVVKDKITPTVWMVNIILAGYMFGMPVVYTVFGIWFIDNYVLKNIKRIYREKYVINREIDKRYE